MICNSSSALRGEHEEGVGQFVDIASHRHPPLLHGLEHRGLRLGRGAVDLIGQDDVGEDRSRNESEYAFAGSGILLDDLGAGDVAGHEVRGELDAFEGEVEGLGQGRDEQCLGEAREADQQGVIAGENRDQQLIDHLILADDHLRQLMRQGLARLLAVLDRLEVVDLFLLARRGLFVLPGGWFGFRGLGHGEGGNSKFEIRNSKFEIRKE
jgi:hypothetical protein